jgi:phospholipase/carboxylesterase
MKPQGPHRALDFELSLGRVADGPPTAVVLLHGRGSDRRDLQGLRPLLPESWTLVTPEAPFPGAPWSYGPGSAWYRYQEEDRVFMDTLDASLEKLDTFLGELPALMGFEPDRLLLGGFSQGGTTAMAYALSRPKAVAAVLTFSGFLVAAAALDESGSAPPRTPIFWAHGTGDPAIPISLAEKGRNRLERAGARLVTRDYRIGHWIVPEEVHDAVDFVEGGAGGPPVTSTSRAAGGGS